jgi:3-oxoacyl-[acyl-carrier protein] reductase
MADRSERRVALVTGGGTGLGRAISLRFAEAGMDVAVNYSRSAAEAAETVEAARARGARAEAYRADVAKENQVAAMIEGVVKTFGRLDVVVSNAGVTTFCSFEDLDGVSEADWDSIIGVNVKGAWFCARYAAPHLRARGAGHLVTISSTAGLITFGSSIPYCVSKAALIHLTRCLAKALAPVRGGGDPWLRRPQRVATRPHGRGRGPAGAHPGQRNLLDRAGVRHRRWPHPHPLRGGGQSALSVSCQRVIASRKVATTMTWTAVHQAQRAPTWTIST